MSKKLNLSDRVKKRANIVSTQSTLVKDLMQVPKKDVGKNIPHHVAFQKDAVHQLDILFLPSDNGYKYCLTVVDIYSRSADGEPIKNKTSKGVVEALKKIYSRPYLNKPSIFFQVDDGTEFKGDFTKYAEENNIAIRRALPNRHRQQAVVEALNGTIARVIFELQNIEELGTRKVNKKWVKILPTVIEEYNGMIKEKKPKKETMGKPTCAGDGCNLFQEGDSVRVILDYPINIATGKKLDGKFRKTDIRWSEEIHKIENIVIAPNQPPLYQVKGIKANYTKNQLKKVETPKKVKEVIKPKEVKMIGTTPVKTRKTKNKNI